MLALKGAVHKNGHLEFMRSGTGGSLSPEKLLTAASYCFYTAMTVPAVNLLAQLASLLVAHAV